MVVFQLLSREFIDLHHNLTFPSSLFYSWVRFQLFHLCFSYALTWLLSFSVYINTSGNTTPHCPITFHMFGLVSLIVCWLVDSED